MTNEIRNSKSGPFAIVESFDLSIFWFFRHSGFVIRIFFRISSFVIRISLQLPPSFQRMAEREFVGKFQTGARGQTMGDAGNPEAIPGEATGQIKTRGVAFDISAEGDYDLFDRLVHKALFQDGDV